MCVYVGLMSLDNMGFVANMVSLVMYFIGMLHFDMTASANTLTNFMGSTFLLSILGGFISDTYIDRFNSCLIFGFLEIIVSQSPTSFYIIYTHKLDINY